MNNLGIIGEIKAAEYLEKQGYKIISTNFHTRFGEIDIIVENEKYIIFVEVKTRKIGTMISGIEAVTHKKQMKILKSAAVFLENFTKKLQSRFDVIEILSTNDGEIRGFRHLLNAFGIGENDYAFF